MQRTGTGRSPQRPHNISQVPSSEHPRSVFDRSHSARLTCDTSTVVPVLCEEVLPGDTYNCRMFSFARLATILRPVLDDLTMTAFFFFTANRLVWEHWTEFQGALDDPGDDPLQYQVPILTKTGQGWATGSIADYFGIPILIPNKPVNALPFRMHDLIFNEWFRDTNLQDRRTVQTGDGPDTDASGYTVPYKRGRRKDYLTGCLPFLQKGAAQTLPLGTTAPVIAIGAATTPTFTTDTTIPYADALKLSTGASGTNIDVDATPFAQSTTLSWNDTGLVADLAMATSATINALRLSNAVQVLYERDARSGSRYPEQLYSQWGVTLPDAQWRPEYLGGGSQTITVHPVAQTSRNEGGEDLGQLGAYGTSHGASGFQKSFSEHGWIIGYISTQARLSYQQALERKWTRLDRVDYYIPALANLGEQAVMNEEIYCVDPDLGGTGVGEIQNKATFGYQERWAEYKYGTLSSIRGLFRSTAAGNLEMYHYGLDFGSLPVLGDTFIQDAVPMDRIVADQAHPELLVDLYFDMKVTRVMPVYSTPSLMTRF